jgi:hypothetical protein
MFLGEGNSALRLSGLAGVHHNNNSTSFSSSNDRGNGNCGRHGAAANRLPSAVASHGQLTPPDDFPISSETMMSGRRVGGGGICGVIRGWMEIWDYAGGSSFRAFVAEDVSRQTRSLFAFFDRHSIGRDLKQAYVPFLHYSLWTIC